jgi:circadian clock protein KaiB
MRGSLLNQAHCTARETNDRNGFTQHEASLVSIQTLLGLKRRESPQRVFSVPVPRFDRTVRFRFRLYVAGDAPNSVQARINLHAICRAHCANSFDIEEVNVLREPLRALADRIRLTPTLIKLSPGPIARIVGTLADRRRVLFTLGLLDRDE